MNREQHKGNMSPTNMADIVADLTDDPSMADAYRQHVAATRIISDLVAVRCHQGLSQREVARKMGVNASAVSRFEDEPDEELKLGFLARYAESVGLHATLLLDDGRQTDAERIKSCVFTIHNELKKLTDIARKHPDDKSLCDGITKFQAEVLINFLVKYGESANIPRVFDFIPQEKPLVPPQKKEKAKVAEEKALAPV